MVHLGLPTRQAGGDRRRLSDPAAAVSPSDARLIRDHQMTGGLLPNRFLLIVGGTGRSPHDHRELLGLIGTPGP